MKTPLADRVCDIARVPECPLPMTVIIMTGDSKGFLAALGLQFLGLQFLGCAR